MPQCTAKGDLAARSQARPGIRTHRDYPSVTSRFYKFTVVAHGHGVARRPYWTARAQVRIQGEMSPIASPASYRTLVVTTLKGRSRSGCALFIPLSPSELHMRSPMGPSSKFDVHCSRINVPSCSEALGSTPAKSRQRFGLRQSPAALAFKLVPQRPAPGAQHPLS